MRMPFGKHSGKELGDIPTPYLRWVLYTVADMDGELHDAIKREYNYRLYGYDPRYDPRRETRRETATPPDRPDPRDARDADRIRSRVIDAVQRCRRKLAAVAHPDRGGSTELMQTANGAFDDLTADVRGAFEDATA